MYLIFVLSTSLIFTQVVMINGLSSGTCTAALNASSTCVSGLSNSSTLLCSGMCQSELLGVSTACENSSDPTIQLLVRAINTLCVAGNSQCVTAVIELETDIDCTTALGDDDTETYCTGTCIDLIDGLLDSCALSETILNDARGINDMRCGTSSGSTSVTPTTGILIVLLFAIIIFLLK